jgi:hypothetical protein
MDNPTALRRLGDDGSPMPSHATTEAILSHPNFALARNHYMRTMVTSHPADPAMRHLMSEIARNVLFNIILGHAARQDDEKPETWLTVGRLRNLFMPFELASPRTFDQMLARMQVVGLVNLESARNDRRRRLVIPTPRMIEEDLHWLADHMSPLAVLFPKRDDYQPALDHDRRYQRAQRIISTHNYGTARDIIKRQDAVTSLLLRQDAVTSLLLRQDANKIVYLYLLTAWEGGDPHRTSVSFEAVASRLTTSRTHVRNLLTDLQDAGMLVMHGRGGKDVEIMPGLWRVVDLFLAASMSGHDLVWQLARRMVAGEDLAAQSTQ